MEKPRVERHARRPGGLLPASALAVLLILPPPPAAAQAPTAPVAQEGSSQGAPEEAEIVPPKAGGRPRGPRLDRGGSVAPPADPCQTEAVDLPAHAITIINGCASPVTLQYLTSAAPERVRQVDLQPGFGLRAPYFGGEPGYWWIWAACPQGFFSTVKVTAVNRALIASGSYACARP